MANLQVNPDGTLRTDWVNSDIVLPEAMNAIGVGMADKTTSFNKIKSTLDFSLLGDYEKVYKVSILPDDKPENIATKIGENVNIILQTDGTIVYGAFTLRLDINLMDWHVSSPYYKIIHNTFGQPPGVAVLHKIIVENAFTFSKIWIRGASGYKITNLNIANPVKIEIDYNDFYEITDGSVPNGIYEGLYPFDVIDKSSIPMASYDTNGNIIPYKDNNSDLGAPSLRIRNIYAGSGTINTSDARLKEKISNIDERYSDFLMDLDVVIYRFTDGKRPHAGLYAQQVFEAMQKNGIDDFAGFIKSPRMEERKTGEFREIDGIQVPITEIVETGEFDYGLRYEEFIALLIQMYQNQKNEINDLKSKI
jgi:hypothetical protein